MTEIAVSEAGADELRRALLRYRNVGIDQALATANETAAEIVVDAALPDVPFRKGGLRSSVRAMASAKSGRAVAGDSRVAYAAAVHWGRKRGNVGSPPGNRKGPNRIAPNPFLWEAAQRTVPKIEPEYRDELMRIITRLVEGAT